MLVSLAEGITATETFFSERKEENMKYPLMSLLMISAAGVATATSMQAEFQPQMSEQPEPPQPQGVIFATVGNTADCDFDLNATATPIQDAIDDPSFGEIRIQTGTYNENLNLTNRDVVIKGGYASCAAAETDSQTFNQYSVDTLIEPTQPTTNPVVTIISNDETRNFVVLENLRLRGGVDNFLLTAGGISTFADQLQLTLNHMWIENNEGLLGGGLSVIGGDTDVAANNVMFLNNTAEQGGGVFCTGENSSLLIDYRDTVNDRFGFYGNGATDPTDGDGGGILIENGCRLSMYTGTDTPSLATNFDVRGLLFNTAANNGGGLSVRTGATAGLYGYQFCFIGCNGNNADPVSIIGNYADNDGAGGGSGGGISVTGAGSEVAMYNGFVWGNQASNGGGVHVDDTAFFQTNSTYDILFEGEVDCWSPGSCNQITENRAQNTGGGIRIENNGSAEVYRTIFTENRANFGTGAYVIGASSVLETESVLFAGNGNNAADGYSDSNVIRLITGGTAVLDFVTMADNNIPDANEIINNSNGTLRLRSSIVHEPNPVAIYSSSSPVVSQFDCLIVHESASLTSPSITTVTDPQFVDRLNGDYHLNEATSPAIDYCDEEYTSPFYKDIDNDVRPWDWSNINNTAGPHDLGFDETTDLIFEDGFNPFIPL
jgi:predicted outer membrane repeat protein